MAHQFAEEDVKWEDAHIFPYEATFRYAEGFKEAAEVLVDHVATSNDSAYWADSLLYPIGYLLRHLLELKLKDALRALGGDPPGHHKLLDLWSEVRALSDHRWPSSNEDDERRARTRERIEPTLDLRVHESFVNLQEAEDIVSELHEIDRSGEAFRYPVRMDGSRSLPDGLTHVDLSRLLGRVLSVVGLLDGIETAVYEESQCESEMNESYADSACEY